MLLQETHFRVKDMQRWKMRGCKKIFHAKGNHDKAGIAMLISDKVDSKTKSVTKDERTLYNDKGIKERIIYNIL